MADPTLRSSALSALALGLAGPDISAIPMDDGLALARGNDLVSWQDMAWALGSSAPDSPEAPWKIGKLLQLRYWAYQHGPMAPYLLADHIKVMALPRDHALHPGDAWVQHSVAGGVIDTGIGLYQLPGLEDPSSPVAIPLPPPFLEALGLCAAQWWPDVQNHAQNMAGICVRRLRRSLTQPIVVRPVGGVDVLALLADAQMREFLGGTIGNGMLAVAAPSRMRAWYDVKPIDSDFIGAVWNVTDVIERAVARALLVTKDAIGQTPTRN